MKHASLTEFRNNLSKLLTAVNTEHEPLIVTRRRGKPVVMISLEDFEAMKNRSAVSVPSSTISRLLSSFAEVDEMTFTPGTDDDFKSA